MLEAIIGLIGVAVGAAITFITELYFKGKTDRDSQSHSATLLFYDLNSIYKFVESCPVQTGRNGALNISIRHYKDWQNRVVDCAFLNNAHIELLYRIYDLVYDYNTASQTGDTNARTTSELDLVRIMLSIDDISERKSYDELMCTIKKHCKD